MIDNFLKEIKGINLLDIGSSGSLSKKFDLIKKSINLIGFDPNREECQRMNQKPHSFLSAKYLPYAVAGKEGEYILNKTKSIYCYSLLQPNEEWLKRFSFSSLFEIIETEKINAKSLGSIPEIKELVVDIIKTDTQGLELPILSGGKPFLNDAFYVETETGFVENYIHETTFSQIDSFMRENYFMLFDINVNHRIGRDNQLKDYTKNEQILWCEATWLKDYISIYNSGKFSINNLTREKALKSLILCALQGCISYGYELAGLFRELNLLDNKELEALLLKENWQLPEDNNLNKQKSGILNYCLRLLPSKLRMKLKEEAFIAANQKHLFKR